MIQEWSAKCSCRFASPRATMSERSEPDRLLSCSQIAQLLAIMRYDEERAVGLAHLIMVCEPLIRCTFQQFPVTTLSLSITPRFAAQP